MSTDYLLYRRFQDDKKRMAAVNHEESIAPTCANGCGRNVDCLGEMCKVCWQTTQEED